MKSTLAVESMDEMLLQKRRMVFATLLTIVVVALVLWGRVRSPSRKATAFADAVNRGDFNKAASLLSVNHATFPDQWANPRHWGNEGASGVHAYVAPLTITQLWRAERLVYTAVVIDAKGPYKIFHGKFRVTARGVDRVPSKADSILYPVVLESHVDGELNEIPDDVSGIPAIDVLIGGDVKKRYFLIGLDDDVPEPQDGYRLLVVLPGGDGSAAFSPFVRRIYQNVLNEKWLIAQMVAPSWDSRQKSRLVWPRKAAPYASARFTTEEFCRLVVADVQSRAAINTQGVYLLAWSSGGPPAYSITLEEKSAFAGAFIAMSVFNSEELVPCAHAKGKSFYLLQSPDDRVTRLYHAQTAKKVLASAGARVKLQQYSGGHGWHGNIWDVLSNGIKWIEAASSVPDQ